MCNYFPNMQPMTITEIVEFEESLDRKETICAESNETFHWTDYPPVGARFQITLEGGAAGMIYASLHLFPLDRVVRPPPEILPIPTVSYLLRDRVSRADGEPTQDVLRQTHAEFGGKSFHYGMDFECRLWPKDWLVSPAYNVKDSVKVEVFVESPTAALAFHSKDGTLKWTIECWSRKREALLKRFVNSYRSPYFYTDKGYRVQAWISIAASNESPIRLEMRRPGRQYVENPEDVVVDIVFLSGLSKRSLPKRYPHLTTLMLKNPRHPDQSVVFESVEWDLERASRYQVVFPAGEIDFDSLLVDDSFLLEVVITAK